MTLHDITTSDETEISVRGREVFVVRDASKDIVFSLDEEGAEAHIFILLEGKGAEHFTLKTKQWHRAPRTKSSLTLLALLDDDATLSWDGLVRIERDARESEASQSCRTILLSEKALSKTLPALEVLAEDASVRHDSVAGPADDEMLFLLASRGIDSKSARKLLADGALTEFLERMDATKSS